MGEGGEGGEGSGVGGGSHFAPGDTLLDASGSGEPGSGSIPRVVWLLIAVIFLAVWGLLSLTR